MDDDIGRSEITHLDSDIVIIDSHAHVDEVPALGWIDPPDKLVALLDHAGIAKAVVMTYTEAPSFNPSAIEDLAKAVAAYPDRLIGYARVHPWYGAQAVALLRRAVTELGMRGLKLHPVGTLSHPADSSTLRLMEVAAELGVPVLFHCGDEPMTTPLAIAAAARQTEATVILGHMGGFFHVEEAIRVAEQHSNVLLETSAMPYPKKIREAVERVGSERVLFASDGPGCRPYLEVRKVLMADLSPSALRHVFHDNIARLLEGTSK
jgi:predicted TIM-barrel fold metal-dependent hydrolase